jgi:hypothetical protein
MKEEEFPYSDLDFVPSNSILDAGPLFGACGKTKYESTTHLREILFIATRKRVPNSRLQQAAFRILRR